LVSKPRDDSLGAVAAGIAVWLLRKTRTGIDWENLSMQQCTIGLHVFPYFSVMGFPVSTSVCNITYIGWDTVSLKS
jgi:hypothetical protein